MNASSASNVSGSGAPVATALPPRAKSSSESAYLKEQSANAKAAAKQTLSEIVSGLGEGVSVRGWTNEHPWIAMSTAAVAGFTAACAAVPSKEASAIRRLKKIEKALHPEKFKQPESNGNNKPPKKGFLASIAGDLIKSAGPALASALAGGFAAGNAADPNGDDFDQTDAGESTSTS